MGNKLCCDENRMSNHNTNEQEKFTPIGEEDNIDYSNNNHKKNNEYDKNKNNDETPNNGLENDRSKENFSEEDIHNLKSSIFDNDNDNMNSNYEDNYNNDNVHSKGTEKRKFDFSGNTSEKNLLKKRNNSGFRSGIKKNKIEDEETTDINKVIKSNPNYQNSPLALPNDKENDFYLINTSKYIGLKNSNSNLVFIKETKDNRITKPELTPLPNAKNIIIDINNLNDNIIKINNNNYSSSNKHSNSNNQNANLSTRSHNLPYNPDNEKISKNHRNNTYSNDNSKSNKKLNDFINKYNVVDRIHNNNDRIIEIYINNQIKKIINAFKNYNKNNKNKKPKINYSKTNFRYKSKSNIDDIYNDIYKDTNENNDKNSNKNNIFRNSAHNSPKKYNLNDNYYNNLYNNNDNSNPNNLENNNNDMKLKQVNNFGKEIDHKSYDILNEGFSKTIIDREKNFCIKYFDNGSVYIGETKNDKCNGHGKYISTKGDITNGFFKDNYLQGYELIERKRNNAIYEGEFDKNKFNGFGIENFEDGSTYYGQYKNNEKSGIGTYAWSDGSNYQGEWINGQPNGTGIFNDNKNRIYEGEWRYGKMNGIGLFKWDDGRKYIGLFNDDKREGFGIFFWSRPLKIYLGFWVNGLQNGVGKIYTSTKEKYYLWEEGKILKKISNNKEFDLQIDKENKEIMNKYLNFFKMTLDDLLTLMLDL